MKKPEIDKLLKHLYDEPHWLAEGERLSVRADVDDLKDGYMLRGHVDNVETWTLLRHAEVYIDGADLARASRSTSRGPMVDLLRYHVDELLEKLEPEPLPDDLMQLAMAAFGDPESCDVLADALLEREAIKPPYRGLRKRADTRTDEERAADLRAELHRKAKAWARPYVEILFRRHWSTKPWAFWEPPVLRYEFNDQHGRIRVIEDSRMPPDRAMLISDPYNYVPFTITRHTRG